ncbi:MAG: hypothetical protein VX642_13650 [Bdellovibrionota bacterium]|nr:hypothetical protein [Bdellovibrionota bacterium]
MINKLVLCSLLLFSFKAFSGNEGGNGGHPTELMWLSSYTTLEESFEKLFKSQEKIIYIDESGRPRKFAFSQIHLSYLKSYDNFLVDTSTAYPRVKISKKDSIIQIPMNAFESFTSTQERVCFVMKSLFHSSLSNLQLPPCEALQAYFSERPQISSLSEIENACETMSFSKQLPVYKCFLEPEMQSSMIQEKKDKAKTDRLESIHIKTLEVPARNSIEAMFYSSILFEENSCKRISIEPQIIYRIMANSFFVFCAREFAK